MGRKSLTCLAAAAFLLLQLSGALGGPMEIMPLPMDMQVVPLITILNEDSGQLVVAPEGYAVLNGMPKPFAVVSTLGVAGCGYGSLVSRAFANVLNLFPPSEEHKKGIWITSRPIVMKLQNHELSTLLVFAAGLTGAAYEAKIATIVHSVASTVVFVNVFPVDAGKLSTLRLTGDVIGATRQRVQVNKSLPKLVWLSQFFDYTVLAENALDVNALSGDLTEEMVPKLARPPLSATDGTLGAFRTQFSQVSFFPMHPALDDINRLNDLGLVGGDQIKPEFTADVTRLRDTVAPALTPITIDAADSDGATLAASLIKLVYVDDPDGAKNFASDAISKTLQVVQQKMENSFNDLSADTSPMTQEQWDAKITEISETAKKEFAAALTAFGLPLENQPQVVELDNKAREMSDKLKGAFATRLKDGFQRKLEKSVEEAAGRGDAVAAGDPPKPAAEFTGALEQFLTDFKAAAKTMAGEFSLADSPETSGDIDAKANQLADRIRGTYKQNVLNFLDRTADAAKGDALGAFNAIDKNLPFEEILNQAQEPTNVFTGKLRGEESKYTGFLPDNWEQWINSKVVEITSSAFAERGAAAYMESFEKLIGETQEALKGANLEASWVDYEGQVNTMLEEFKNKMQANFDKYSKFLGENAASQPGADDGSRTQKVDELRGGALSAYGGNLGAKFQGNLDPVLQEIRNQSMELDGSLTSGEFGQRMKGLEEKAKQALATAATYTGRQNELSSIPGVEEVLNRCDTEISKALQEIEEQRPARIAQHIAVMLNASIALATNRIRIAGASIGNQIVTPARFHAETTAALEAVHAAIKKEMERMDLQPNEASLQSVLEAGTSAMNREVMEQEALFQRRRSRSLVVAAIVLFALCLAFTIFTFLSAAEGNKRRDSQTIEFLPLTMGTPVVSRRRNRIAQD